MALQVDDIDCLVHSVRHRLVPRLKLLDLAEQVAVLNSLGYLMRQNSALFHIQGTETVGVLRVYEIQHAQNGPCPVQQRDPERRLSTQNAGNGMATKRRLLHAVAKGRLPCARHLGHKAVGQTRVLAIPQERHRPLAKSGHDYHSTALFDDAPEQPIRVLLGSTDGFEQPWHEHLRLEARQGYRSYVVLGLQEARLSSAGFLRQLLRSDIVVIGDN